MSAPALDRPAVPARALDGLRKLAGALASPLVPSDYLDLFDPLRAGADLRGKVVSVEHETADAVTTTIRPGKGWRGPVVRNLSTTHLLDRVAAAHGETCHEVPVGFKWISAAMAETDAVIGGESSGGLTVRGHIPGKDGIQAGSLLVEMVARSGKSLSAIYADIVARYGELVMEEAAYGYTPQRREELQRRIFEEHELPAFDREIDRISWEDGCKVYFADDSWLTIRFSGTEPVIRVFSEAETAPEAQQLSRTVATHYRLGA